jgi:low affinity Fe/Cu permease
MTAQASWFSALAKAASRFTGRPLCFMFAGGLIAGWLITGPLFGFSDTWQLVINTATTIVTFLMVFLIQNTQYRDTQAIQLKLDELIRATKGAHNALLDLEDREDESLERVHRDYRNIADRARQELAGGGHDDECPELEHGPEQPGEAGR